MLLIKSGTLITASETFVADLLIDHQTIIQIGQDLHPADAEIVDASGKLVMPGGIDPHTHFDLPMFGTVSSDDHYTGHKAAAFGGTTTVMDFVSFDFPTFRESVAAWKQKTEKAAIDYSFHMNLTRFDEQIAAEMAWLVEAGMPSVKVFTAYNGRLRLADGDIFRAMQRAHELGLLVMAHCENGDVIERLIEQALAAGHTSPEWHALTRPAWGAVEAGLRLSGMASVSAAKLYIVHMNAAGEVDMLRYARERGVRVYGETCPQYLFFTVDHLRRPDGSKWVCSPPMRGEADNARLWEGVSDGTIDTIGTDHCPFFFDGTQPIIYEGEPVAIPGKELGNGDFTKIPNGLPGVGDRLPILWTYGVRARRITPNQFVALTSTNPAKIFGLYPRKGALIPGADADILIWDPDKKVKYGVAHARHRTDYNLYEGWELVGYPEKVFLRGQLIVDGEEWKGARGMGQFVERAAAEID
jgi:dihydropyrimidinase